jgi:hypothetical protein
MGRDKLQLERHQPERRAEDRAADTFKRARYDVSPEGDRPHHHHQGDERPGAFRNVKQAHQHKGEHKGQCYSHAMDDAVMAIQPNFKWLK